MKICSKCNEKKSDSCFAWKSKKNKKRAASCKDCNKQYYEKRYKTHSHLYKENAKKQRKTLRERNRKFVIGYKEAHPCQKCGESHPACLDFHHPNDDKEATVSSIARETISIARIRREIDKCQVLCANCHRKEHWPR